jgi:outer membrane protein
MTVGRGNQRRWPPVQARWTLGVTLAACSLLIVTTVARAQAPPAPTVPAGQPAPQPAMITLEDALRLARENSPELQSAAAVTGTAHAARLEARALLLPSVSSVNSYIYTQPNGTDTGRFIGNNGTREYINQAVVHHEFGVAETAGYRSAAAAEDVARAQAEIVARGLLVTVVGRYDAVVVAQRKLATAQQAQADAQQFLTITQDRERVGEAAHADVVKAQIQLEQRQREFQEAQLLLRSSRNGLAVVIFPQYETDFTLEDDLQTPAPLPSFDVVQTQASANNPEIAAAEAALRQAGEDVWAARGQILPSIALDYLYGLDARQFAASSNGVQNLGYSVVASVNVPLWLWGASQSQIAVAHLRQQQARTELSFAQRQLLANLDSFYQEAQTALAELESLQRSVDLASESLRLTTLRYQAGEATVLEVVDAQTTLVDAKNTYDDGNARYHLALANLQTLTGTF